ncbi:hypothetical protein VFPPC_07959 [Pochonia chlamydosporia 170]|uniref:Uncharacterized protein n=1 Tax=Pochonia chlamydosporia 170 TaxID=1380566 RepID=A0A179FM40_METCM|nr:hypothetical protein VFPPC_07959 [Pochonia chlamydosporia 170]OAQ66398.1 hypothetical protein VFPPC_07959 [Pochonia chlamydosporia 170]
MVLNNDPRRRPVTPSLKLSRDHLHIDRSSETAGPTSPPETPTGSPQMVRKPQHPASFYRYSRPLAQDPNIKPVGNGHQFSYQRVLGPEQLSPRSSSSDESDEEGETEDESDDDSLVSDVAQPQSVANSSTADASDDMTSESDDDDDVDDGDDEDDGMGENEDDDDDGDGEEQLDLGIGARPHIQLSSEPRSATVSVADSEAEDAPDPQPQVVLISTTATLIGDFVIEDIDPMDSGCEGLEVLFPTEIESNRSRSRSRHKEFHKGMVRDFKNLNCSNETSDNEGGPEADAMVDNELLFHKRQKEIRRIRRVSMSSSFGKRTHSELSESDDSDTGGLDVNDVGSSARRMRKRLHRGSLLFQDPPAPRIDELDEPDSSEDEYDAADPFARELPYWTMEIMEMDSSSS